MQQWTRHNQCIFCQFRAAYKYQQRVISGYRQYTLSTSLLEDTRERPVRRRHATERSLIRFINPKRDSRDTVPSRERRRELAREKKKGAKNADSKRKEILRALRVVKGSYKAAKMSETSQISQMAGLDPEGVLWPQFEANVIAAVDNIPSLSKRRSNILGIDLDAALDDEFRSTVERSIRFAFLDYVLDNSNVLKSNAISNIDLRYPTEWYSAARSIQRVIHLHVGPTNSGKTYNALKRLEEAGDGFYAGPLRLLAHEVFSRFNNRGIKCDLLTGDDVRQDESGLVKLYASTVEMVSIEKDAEVGVIDEIQMLGDAERGWAWTRALLSARVKELHLCGEARAVPLIREIIASTGDTLHIHQYERLNPLKVMSKSLKGNLQNLRKGDCVVSFSIVNIHALKRQIELDTGRRCAIIYGSLPPETRAQQAALFNDPDNDYDFLAASDAIGMGLNLSIKRVVFETTKKWNGSQHVQLSIPQMKQIGGRAGRYRTARDDRKTETEGGQPTIKPAGEHGEHKSIGLVTCLDEVDLPVLQHALANEGTPIRAAGLLPPGEVYQALAERLPDNTPFEYILKRITDIVATNHRFRMCDISDQLQIARAIEEVSGLSVRDRLLVCASPAPWGSGKTRKSLQGVTVALARAIAAGKGVTVADILEIPLEVLDDPMSSDRNYLTSLEGLHKAIILYLWLSYRFPRIFVDRDMAIRAKELCEQSINTTLLKFSANPQLRLRLAEMRKSSELLKDSFAQQQQEDSSAAATEDVGTLNPDKTVEEIDREHELLEEQNDRDGDQPTRLEEKIEVEGELDLGMEEDQRDVRIEEQEEEEARGASTATAAVAAVGGSG